MNQSHPVEPEYILEHSEKTLHSTVLLGDSTSKCMDLVLAKLKRLSLQHSMAIATLKETLDLLHDLEQLLQVQE